MNKLRKIVRLEDDSRTDGIGTLLFFTGMFIMLATFTISGGSWLSLLSGVLGVASVVFCSQKKVSSFFYGFAQLITYVILCLQHRLYGEIAENVFYFVTMIYGMYHWMKHYNYEEAEIETRSLNAGQKAWVFIITSISTLILFNILVATDDTQPFMDAVTTAPAFVAQILMISRYKDSWVYWFIIDAGAIPMWVVAGDWCMVAQYVFWSINCIYGFYKWKNDKV